LAVRGWTADLRLWLRAFGAGVPQAATFVEVLKVSSEPAHVAVFLLLATASDLSGPERSVFLDLARHSLAAGAQWGDRLDVRRLDDGTPMVGTTPAIELTWIHLALRSLLELADDPRALDTAAQLAAWLARRVPNADGVRVIGALSTHGCTAATDVLLEMRAALPSRSDLGRREHDELGRTISMQLLAGRQPPFFFAPDVPAAQEATP
jgi:hypothetical protein